jgi:hypothetical protein
MQKSKITLQVKGQAVDRVDPVPGTYISQGAVSGGWPFKSKTY